MSMQLRVIKMGSDRILQIQPHTQHKYSILRKYLGVCKTFNRHYSNAFYIDTHGGSGQVSLEGQSIDGSPRIAASTLDFPCHIIEIDPERFKSLCESTNGCSNVTTYNGDCNQLISSILNKVPQYQRFVFCFVDPESLTYTGEDGTIYDQLCADTVRMISGFPRSELLLNFPLHAILRCAVDWIKHSTEPRAISTGKRVSTYMGSENWRGISFSETNPEHNRRAFLELYVDEMLGNYPYKGSILIRSEEKKLPLYYLIYASHNMRAASIMRDIMKKEGNYSLYIDLATGEPQTLDSVYPLEKFIFD